MTRLLFLFMLTLLLSTGYAQTESENLWELPPLQMLIDSAFINSPLLKSADVEIELSEIQLTEARRKWMQKININADTRFGSMVDYRRMTDMQSAGVMMPSNYMLTLGAGFGVSTPLSDFFDRKRHHQKAQLQMDKSVNSRTDTERQVRTQVINAYFEVLSAQKILATRAELVSSAAMLSEQSQTDYAENRIGLADYIKANDALISGMNDLELQKFAVLKAVYTLEVLVGIQLIK